MKKFLKTYLCVFLITSVAVAQEDDFSKYFEVDLDAPVPDLEILKEEYENNHQIYNPRYVVSWELGKSFDKVWRQVITSYGSSEKRLKNPAEDDLLALIVSLPKEMYPYIGPYLHSVPGISEKILNLPGIKETKNKFPDRIAPQLEGIEDLEFLSPSLYFLLMPEMWPENSKPIEQAKKRPAKLPKADYNNEFYAKLFDMVPQEGYSGNYTNANIPLKDKLRTLQISKSSPLKSADIRAFANTLEGVLKFSTLENKHALIVSEALLDYYEEKNGTALYMNTLKDMVNPCQRLALKIKWAGLETEFSKAIAHEGFNLKDWAYTCDKVVKAYRTSIISAPKVAALKQYKNKIYDKYINTLQPVFRERQKAMIYTVLGLYKTNENDVIEVLKNENLIKEKLYPFGPIFVTSPLSLN